MGSNDGESQAHAERPGGEFHVELKNPGQSMLAEGMFEARLVFPPRRTRIKNVRLRMPHGDTQPDVASEGERKLEWIPKGSVLLWVAWDKPLARGEGLSLTVTYEGERPMDPEIDPDVPHLQQLLPGDRENELDRERSNLLAGFVKRRKECIEEVRKKEPTRADQMEFFLDYDLATNPEFVERENVTLAKRIKDSIKILVDLVTNRVSPGHTVPLSEDDAKELSDIQLTIFWKHFGDPIDFVKFREAFIAFASGKLEAGPGCVSKWNGKPNSANFFLFAEFAIQAHAQGVVRKEVWESILPVFVECQDLYANGFKPFCNYPKSQGIRPVPCHKRNFGMYGDAGAKRATVDWNTVWGQMGTRYAGIQGKPKAWLEDMHTDNAKRFFPLGNSGSTNPCEALRAST